MLKFQNMFVLHGNRWINKIYPLAIKKLNCFIVISTISSIAYTSDYNFCFVSSHKEIYANITIN